MSDWDWPPRSSLVRQRNQVLNFESQYYCQSTTLAGKNCNDGDKIYLPPSALDRLARMNVEYPMLFEVTSNETGKRTHCGVLEFSADEGYCYMPYWMMENLAISEHSLVKVKNVSLKKATFVKFRARSVDFLDINNPRALLEVTLRNFTCLTVGDTIKINHLGKTFEFDVREVQPNDAASIIETDCMVDFDEPLGYKNSKYAQHEQPEPSSLPIVPRVLQKAKIDEEQSVEPSVFKPFAGSAKRIDGKIPLSSCEAEIKTDAPLDSKQIKAPAEISTPVSYSSTIGDKYSKKKIGVAAFAGAARKLNG